MANTNLIFKIVTALPATKTPHTVYMVYNSVSPTSAKFCMTDSSGNVVLNTVSQDDVTQAIAGIPAQVVTWGSVTEKPAVIAAGADADAARTAIGAGTSNLVIGTTATTAKAGNYVPTWAEVTSKPAVIAAGANAAAARTAIGAGTSNLVIGTTASTAKAGNYVPTWTEVTSKPAVIAAGTDAAAARAAIGAGTLNDAPNDGKTYVRDSAAWRHAAILDGGNSPNLLFNGGFELGSIGWTIGVGSVGVNTLWGNCWTYTIPSGPATGSISSERFPVVAGGTYTVTGDSLMTGDSGSGSVYFDMIFYNGALQTVLDGAQRAVTTNHEFSHQTQRDAHRISQVAPAGATSASARFVWTSVSAGASVGCRLVSVHGGSAEIDSPYSNEATIQKLVPLTGALLTGELKSEAPNNYRIRSTNGSTFWRNDGTNFYLLKTASGDPDGNWDNARPLTLNIATGILNINGNAATATTAGNVTGTVAIANGGTGNTTSRGAYVGNKSNRQQQLNGSQTTHYLTAGTEYSVYSPTQNPVFVGVLPETPAVGDEIVFFNGWGTWDTGRFSVMRGNPNHSINNQTDSILFDTNEVRLVRFTYVWSNIWIVSLE